jgi:hypothetical protein
VLGARGILDVRETAHAIIMNGHYGGLGNSSSGQWRCAGRLFISNRSFAVSCPIFGSSKQRVLSSRGASESDTRPY